MAETGKPLSDDRSEAERRAVRDEDEGYEREDAERRDDAVRVVRAERDGERRSSDQGGPAAGERPPSDPGWFASLGAARFLLVLGGAGPGIVLLVVAVAGGGWVFVVLAAASPSPSDQRGELGGRIVRAGRHLAERSGGRGDLLQADRAVFVAEAADPAHGGALERVAVALAHRAADAQGVAQRDAGQLGRGGGDEREAAGREGTLEAAVGRPVRRHRTYVRTPVKAGAAASGGRVQAVALPAAAAPQGAR